MKIILLVAMVAFAAASPSIKDQWTSFKKQHGKSYHSIQEEKLRMVIFSETLKTIEEHNAKYNAGQSTYYLEMNQFGDMLPAEVTQLGFNKTGKINNVPSFTYLPPVNVEIAESVDWRQSGAVTPIKNQGSCGSCWAFSTTGAIEGQLFRKTGKLVSLSEQQLVDCSTDNNGCSGGLMDYAFEYLEEAGLESEDSYPYEGKDRRCRYNKNKVVAGTKVKAYTDIKSKDDEALRAAVATVGPVSIAVSANNRHFLQYAGGVFNGDTCQPSALDHGILLVGYGSGDGDDYWLIKNSWGPKWGEKGFMRLTRAKKNACGISSSASYPILQ
ncbi:cathepsin L [Halyomorpha halys]|uniref:cathepsin L n=1 Tax=Halyomorpha halys TaxID=286706 RepID=UPI0006D4E116|nr:cathepsin L1-like [Halyomorpha halys]